MFGVSDPPSDERRASLSHTRPKARGTALRTPADRRRRRAYRPGNGGPAFDVLEERRLLSSDLTQAIDNLLTNGVPTGSVTLPNVTLGSFFSADSVTVSFQNISQQGADWSGTVDVSANTATLTLGSKLTAQIQGDAQNSVGIAGSYTLNNEPLGQGAYALSVTELDVNVPNILTGTANGVQLSYDPAAAPGQELAQVGALSATLTALDNVTATLNNLDIFDNGFSLANGSVTADALDIGSMLAITSPTVTFTGAAYTVGSPLTGTIGLSSSNVTLFPGKANTATVDGFSGTYDLSQSALSLSATSTEIDFGTHVNITAESLDFSLAPDPNGGEDVSVTVGSATADLPDLNISGTITGLAITNTGFSIASASFTDTTSVAFGSVLSFTNPTATFTSIDYSTGGSLSGTVDVKVQSATLFPEKSNTATVDGFDAKIDLGAPSFDISATDASIDFGTHVSITAESLDFSLAPDPNGGEDVSVTVGSATVDLPDLNINGTITGLAINNTGFSIASASFTDTTSVAFGSVLSFTNPTATFTSIDYSTTGSLSGTVEVKVQSATLFPGKSNTATVDGFDAKIDLGAPSFDISATDASIDFGTEVSITAESLDFSLAPDPNGGEDVSVTVGSATVDLPDLNINGTITGLAINNTGFSIASASFTDTTSVAFGSVLSFTNPTATFTSIDYSTGGSVSGTVEVKVQSATLFPGKSNTATVDGFDAKIDLGAPSFDISATDASIDFGTEVSITAESLDFSLAPDPNGGEDVSITVGSATADFPQLNFSGSITGLTIDNTGFSIASATFTEETSVAIGSVLTFTDPSVTFTGVSFDDVTGLQGDIAVSVASASLFPGKPSFNATVDTFKADYNFTANSADVSAKDAVINVGGSSGQSSPDLTITASGLDFSLASDGTGLSADLQIDQANVDFPRLNFNGSINGLSIDNDGFSLASASVTYTGTVSLDNNIFSVTNPNATFTGFGYSLTNGPSFGGLEVGAAEIDLKPTSSTSFQATTITGAINFNTNDFTFSAGSLTATLGSYLTLSGTGISFDTDPPSNGDIATIDSIGAAFTLPGGTTVGGTVTGLAIGANGSLTSAPGTEVGGSLSLTNAGSLKWPSWLPIQVTDVGIKWPDFSANPTDFVLNLSASVNASIPGTTVTLSGSVTDAQIDTGLLEAGQFPITGLDGASISIGGSLFGAAVNGTLFVAVLNVDSQGNVIPDGNPQNVPVANHYLYGGIEGGVNIEGLGGVELQLGVSQFGLLDGFIDVSAPILLDPDTGLAITNLHAGIEFGQTLPSITDAHLLNPANDVMSTSGQNLSALTPPGQQTTAQWESGLQYAMANVAKGIAQGQDPTKTLYSNFIINAGATLFDEYASEDALRIDGDVLVDSTGKLEIVGGVTIGDSISLKGAAYIDLSQVASPSHNAQLLLYAQGPSQAPIVTAYGNLSFSTQTHTVQVPTGPDLGTGLSLDGSTDYVTANNINLNNTSYTVEFWAQRADTGRTEYVIGQGDPNTANDLQIGFDANNNFFVTQDGKTLDSATTDNKWHHWAVTFDQSTGTLSINLDGQQVATQTGVSPLQSTSTTFLIGKSGSTYFDGSVDEVRVWSVARAAADIQSDYQSSTPATTTGLVADWNFNEGQGTTASDSSGNGNTATLEGTPTWAITLVNPPAANSFTSFTLTIGGEVDLTVPDLPTEMQITGSAVFTVTPGQKSLDLSVSGNAPIADVGLDVGVAGNVHFDVNASGTPELYGILQLQVSDLSQLQQLGIIVQGTAVLEFNTTGSVVTGSFQLPDATTSTTFNYTLPAQSASLSITGDAEIQEAGQTWFTLQGQLYAFFGVTKDASGNIDPELQFYIGCNLLVGPSTSPIIEFTADGFLQVSDAGVAANISVSLVPTPLLAQVGIDLTGNTFNLDLNTTGQEVKFTVPQLSVPAQTGTNQPGSTPVSGTVPSAGSSVDIPAAPTGVTTPEPYLSLGGNANVNIENAFVLNANLTLLVVPGTITLQLNSLNYTLQVGSTVIEQFTGAGGILINDANPSNVTFAAALELQQSTPFSSSYGFGLNASFELEADTTGQAQTLGGLTVPAANAQGNTSYAQVHASGDLTVGGFDLNGSFDFIYNGGTNASAQIIVSANASLGPIGSAEVFGDLNIQNGSNAGVDGVLEATLQGAPSLPISVGANFELEINTTGQQQTVSTVVNGQVAGFTVNTQNGAITPVATITLPSTDVFTLVAGGMITIDGLFNLQGEFDFTSSTSGLNINAHADLTSFFGASFSLWTNISVVYPTSAGPGGLAVNAGLTLNSGSLGVGLFSITATPTLMINTTQSPLDGVNPDTYEVALNNASLNIFGFSASGSLIVGVSDGIFEIDVPQSNPLNVSFLGLGNLQASGYLKSNGQFSLTGSVGFDLGQSGNELYGSIGATISNSGFSGWFSGGASVFGINVASASGWLSINGGEVDLGVSVWIIGIQFGFNFDIGHVNPPPISAPLIYFYGVPSTSSEGSSITLSAAAADGSGNPYNNGDYQWTVYRNGQYFTSGNGANDTFTLGEPGTYAVDLSVDGLSRSSTIQVNDVAPTIQSTGIQTAYTVYNPGQSLSFTPNILTALPADVPNLKYTWTVSGNFQGKPGTETFNSPTLAFTPDAPQTTPQLYKITLTVADAFGGSATSTTTTAFFNPANIQVNTTDDQANIFSENGVTYVPLRAAITAAVNPSGATNNVLPIVKFNPSLAGDTIMLTSAGDTSDDGRSAFAIPTGNYIELDGSGAPGLTIAAAPGTNMRLFYVGPRAELTLFNLNLTGGIADASSGSNYGGAIYADGGVNIYNSALYGNQAIGQPLFSGNFLTYQGNGEGGAVYVSPSGSLSTSEVTFANNQAIGAPAEQVYGEYDAYYGFIPVPVTGYYSTYGGQGLGGAIYSADSISLNSSTIADNSATDGSGAAYAPNGAGVYDAFNGSNSYLKDIAYSSIVALNTGGTDYYITNSLYAYGGSNLIDSIANAPPNYTALPNFVVSSANPLLGPFADHGDGVKTFSLLTGSPAIGIGVPGGTNNPTDGRGYPHTVGNGEVYDIGAFQTQPYLVTNANDSGPGSLRAAVAEDDNGAPIQFAAGLAGEKITLTSGPIVLGNNVTINGPGGGQITITAAPPTPTAQWTGSSTQGLAPIGSVSAAAGPFAGTQAFQFSGGGSLTAPDNAALDSPTFTVGGWFKLTQAPAAGTEYFLASKYGGRYNGWILRVNSALTLGVSVFQSPTAQVYVPTSSPLSLNQWYYITASYDGTTARLYVNGVQSGAGSLPGGYVPSSSEPTYASTPSPSGLTLGGASWYFTGGFANAAIADFSYFNTSLDASSIAGLAQPAPVDTRVFTVNSGVSATISGVTISGGHAEQGGGIYNAGTLTLNDDVLSLNAAQGFTTSNGADNGLGGAVFNAAGAALVATDSTFEFNSAAGGTIAAGVGGVGRGGAVYNAAGAELLATNDTFAGNSAAAGNGAYAGVATGGAIDNVGTAYLADDTIANGVLINGTGTPTVFASDGIGINNEGGATLTLDNTIVVHAAATNVVGTDVANAAVALFGNPPATVTGVGNVVMTNDGLPAALIASKADPDLGPLGNYGGPTPTFAPRVGSLAIDAGVNNPAITGPGLFDSWQADGTASDSAGIASGTLIGGVTYAPGVAGQAFSLNGSGYVALPPSADLVGSIAFSVSAWIKTTTANGIIIQQRDAGNFNGEYVLGVSNGMVNFWSYGNSQYDFNFSSVRTVNDGNWHLITAVRLANGTGQIYIDGTLNASAAGPIEPLGSNVNVYIGADVRNLAYGSNPEYFNGLIDQVGLYNHALSPFDVQALYQLATPTQGTDQRGFARLNNGTVDIGSVETQPYLVTNTNDSGPGSLRAAIAGDLLGDQPVLFAPSLNGQTITLTSGPIVISQNVNIVGPGAGELTVNGGNAVQDFVVAAGNVTISGLTIANGFAPQGGGLYNSANLTLANDVFTGDTAENDPAAATPDGQGGAIYNAQGATLNVTGTTFSNDFAIGLGSPSANPVGQGGAIYNAAPTVSASGLVTGPGGTLDATDDTFNGNAAQQERHAYGSQGYNILGYQASLPSYATVSFAYGAGYTWAAPTNDPRALQNPSSGTLNRSAATEYSTTANVPLNVTVNLTDGQPHTVSLYLVDYDSSLRAEQIQLITTNGGYTLGSPPTITNFHNGVYVSWVVQGNVTFLVTPLSGNAVVSGVFIDPAPAGVTTSGTFLGTDTVTKGNWKFGPSGSGLGGAIDNEGTATLLSDTIDGNSVASNPAGSSDGAGIENGAHANLTIYSTIVANDNGGHDLANLGVITGDHNLVMTNTGVTPSVIATSADPKLGPLANNGGPTPTMALLAGSPAIDAGDNTFAPATDQRGLPRIAGAATDIGAYEYATPIVVTNTNDSGPGSLRAALGLVTTYSGSPISFAPSLAGQTIHLSGELYIQNNVTIDGSAAPGLVIQGNGLLATNGSSRDVYIYPGVTAVIRNLTFTGGYADIGGGIANNGGTLTLQDDTIEGNNAFSAGAGVYNVGTLTIIDSTIANNTLSSVASWPSLFQGGGVYNGGTLTFDGDTIAGNSAIVAGQGVGGGVASAAGSATIHNTIVYGNTAVTGPDLDVVGGTVTSLGHNLLGNIAGTFTKTSTDVSGVNPLLGPLQNNGGPTPTMALLAGSPAIDAGDPMNVPATDQRGFLRDYGSAPDIGAYERQPFVVTSTAATGPGSLAQLLAEDHDGSTITFAPALAGQTITLGGTVPSGTQTMVVGSRLVISGNVTIDGSAAPGLVISGGNAVGVLEIAAGANVTLSDLSIEHGSAVTGGGILVDAGGMLTLNGDTIAYNNATGNGGGLENLGTENVVESTFADNTAGGNGGGIDTKGTLTLQDATIGHNTANVGGGLFMEGGTVTAHNTIIGDNNAPTDPDLSAVLTSQGYNMIGNAEGVTGTVSTDMVGVDPQLGPLQNNGGPTETLAPAATSAAIDGGDPTGAPTTDQRGLPRVAGLAVDVGALESQYVPPIASPGGGSTGYIIRAGDSLTLDASGSYDPDGLPLTYSWNINGDGVYGQATGVSPTLTWAQLEALGITPSTTPYQVRVQVTDGYAADSYPVTSGSTNLVVLPGLNIVSLTASSSGDVNSPVTSATATFSSPINPATIDASDVSLTLDGGPNLITGAVQVQPVTGTLNAYQITGLSAVDQAQGQYTLTLNAAGVAAADGSGTGSGTASVTWLMDTTPPDSNVASLAAVQTGTSFAVTAVGDDPSPAGVPASGLVACDLYVSTNGGPYVYWTTVYPWAPTAIFHGQQDHAYAFYSIGHDAAGNSETPTPAEAKTFVPDLTAPVTHVTAVNSSTSVFKVSYAGADSGGSGLAHINLFVQVDGGKPQLIGTETAASGTVNYQAIVDGHPHAYRFYSTGVDNAGNVQAVPTNPQADVVVTAKFSIAPPPPPPAPHSRRASSCRTARRSGSGDVRYVDIVFNQSSGLQSLISGNEIHLIKHNLNGQGTTVMSLAGDLHVVDQAIEIDFGPGGVGGTPNSVASDGYYEIEIDGIAKPFYFDRLLGDVNGDGVVNATDVRLVSRSAGERGANLASDVNGDGRVTLADVSLARRSVGRRLGRGLPLSD